MKHWISCAICTVLVTTGANGIIVKAAPMVRRFLGQPLDNLLKWAVKQGGFQHVKWED
jgi:hypothetical protein